MESHSQMDTLLQYAGGFGRYQIRLSVILFLSVVFSGMHMGAMMFEGMSPTYYCEIPYRQDVAKQCNLNWTGIQQSKASVYTESKENVDPCKRWLIEDSPLLNNCEFWTSNFSHDDVIDVNVTTCEELKIGSSYVERTIVSEFDLGCGGEWQTYLSQSLFMLGVFMNGLIFGYISDKFGRKSAFMTAIVVCGGVGTAVAFGNSFVVFCILRSITGAAFIFPVSFVIALEAVHTNYRAHVGQMLQCGFAMGIMLLSPLAYVTQDWRKLQLIISVPMLSLLLCWCILYESSRWLMSVGRNEIAAETIKKMAVVNKVSLNQEKIVTSDGVTEKLTLSSLVDDMKVETLDSHNVSHLFLTPGIRWMTINLFYNWFSACCVYYGLIMSAVDLGSNPFVSTVLGSIVEIIATILVVPAVNLAGRRCTVSLAFFTSGVSCMIVVFLPNIEWLTLTFYLIGKLGITFVFGAIFVQTSELYPTVLRSIGTGCCSSAARVGGIVSPFVAMLVRYNPILPYFIFGILSLVSAFLTLQLPETLNENLSNTISECEDFIKTRPGVIASRCRKRRAEEFI